MYLYNYFSKLRTSLNYCNLISISSYIQKVLLQHGYQSVVIPNMIEPEKFDSPARSGLPTTKLPVVLFIGSLINSKGPLLLLKAIKGLDCCCKIYGEGILRSDLQQFITKYNLNAQIYEPVPYEKIPEIYATADIVVFPSLWPEPFGRIALEAMAAGKPIIASRIGGIAEVITPETGLLFEPNNVADLRGKIIAFLEDPGESMSINSRKLALQYSSNKISRLFINEYKRIITINHHQKALKT